MKNKLAPNFNPMKATLLLRGRVQQNEFAYILIHRSQLKFIEKAVESHFL